MITKLQVSNFKAVSELELHLGTLNVLVGTNNSGKTSVIHAVQFCVASAQSAAINSRAKWKGEDYDTTLGPEQLLWSPTENAFDLANGSSLSRTKPIRVEFSTDTGTSASIELARGKNRNLTVRLKGASLGTEFQALESPFSVYVPGLAGISRTERFLSPGLVRRMVAQGDANLVFRNVLLLLKEHSTKWSAFESRFHELFPGYDIIVEFEEQYDEYLTVIVRDPAGGERPIDTAGTGMLQVIQVLAYAGLYEPQLLLLDEPDAHLHPDNQRLLCKVLAGVAEASSTQIVISTHSHHIMDALTSIATLHWLQNGGPVDGIEPQRISILADLGALGLQDKLIGGSTRCLVVTEDTETEGLRSLLEGTGFRMYETQIASYRGSSNLVAARVLAEFVKEIAPAVIVVIHIDRDGMSEGEMAEAINKLAAEGIRAFVTKGNDVESYFFNANHINALHPDVEIDVAAAVIEEVVDELREESFRRLVNIRSERNFKRPADKRQDQGTIASDAATDFDSNPLAFVNSKRALSRVCGKLQNKLGRNVALIAPSSHVSEALLTQLALDLWPEVAVV